MDRAPKTRALAIRAMGRADRPELFASLKRWAKDPHPQVRQAAIVLLGGDFPGQETARMVLAAAGDKSPEVRVGASHAMGFGQLSALVDVLDDLLGDKNPKVRDAAAMVLVSLPPMDADTVLKYHMEDKEYRPVFVNALARQDPGGYLDELADVINNAQHHTRWWGGRNPYVESWDILFKYVQSYPADVFQKGDLDDQLDALEKPTGYGSSAPLHLYALYLRRGLTDRASKLRQRCINTYKYDIERSFKNIDENPSLYNRQYQ